MRPYVSWPAGFSIAPEKLTGYLLNERGNSPAKARWWLAQGFRIEDPSDLQAALFAHTTASNFVGITLRPRWSGHSLIFKGWIDTPNGGRPNIRSVWQVDYATPAGLAGIARLITAHRCRTET